MLTLCRLQVTLSRKNGNWQHSCDIFDVLYDFISYSLIVIIIFFFVILVKNAFSFFFLFS